jgi:hypothetical protein
MSQRAFPWTKDQLSSNHPINPSALCARLLAYLANLFLAVTTPSQFGFLGLCNKERHPGFRLMRRHRGVENALRMFSEIGWIGSVSRIGTIGEATWFVDVLQEWPYRL